MTRLSMLTLVIALAAVPALGERLPAASNSLAVTMARPPEPYRADYFEDFETFTVGSLAGQQGWSGWAANISVISDTPISGARSARHTSDGSGWIGFEILSPTFAASYGILAADIRLSGPDVTYQFNTLGDVLAEPNSTNFYFNTGVQFTPGGDIRVLQVTGGGAPVFMGTSGTWTPGVAFQIGVEVLAGGTLNVYKDATLIFSGLEIGYARTGIAGRTKQYLGWTDNAVGFAGQNMTIDNFTNVLVPEPGPLALLMLLTAAGRVRRP